MNRLDYNIEFAHIYADAEFGEEQIKSTEILKTVVKELNKSGKTYCSVILIDEFSPKMASLNENTFLSKIKSCGVNFDFIAKESKLVDASEKLILEIPEKYLRIEKFDKKEVLLLVKDKLKIGLRDENKPTCALLIAAWILCRFGVFEILKDTKSFSEKQFHAKKLITILSEKYRESENKVLNILKATKYNKLIKNIEYRFF